MCRGKQRDRSPIKPEPDVDPELLVALLLRDEEERQDAERRGILNAQADQILVAYRIRVEEDEQQALEEGEEKLVDVIERDLRLPEVQVLLDQARRIFDNRTEEELRVIAWSKYHSRFPDQ